MSVECTVDREPLVSIIVPVYNSERYLSTLLDSLLNQTYRNLEVICINDGSKDTSLQILKDYSSQDARVVVVDKENSGAAATRNVGLDRATGEFLCFVDSDDYVIPTAIERLVGIAVEHDTDAVIFDMDNFDDVTGETSPTNAVVKEFVPSRTVFQLKDIPNFYKRIVGFTVNKLYRSSYLKEMHLRFPQLGAHEDMPFTYVALSAARTLYYLDETLYYYRRSREGSLSDGTNDDYRFMVNALESFRLELVHYDLWDACKRDFINYALHMCHWKYTVLSRRYRWAFGGDCRRNIFKQFDITDYDQSYFYDSDDYSFFMRAAYPSLSYRIASSGMYFVQKAVRAFE